MVCPLISPIWRRKLNIPSSQEGSKVLLYRDQAFNPVKHYFNLESSFHSFYSTINYADSATGRERQMTTEARAELSGCVLFCHFFGI